MEIHPWYRRDTFKIQQRFAADLVIIQGYALLAEGKMLEEKSKDGIVDAIAKRLGITRVQVALA
jgi:diketogulonate reductase-like aldo/keto reductase